MKNIRILYLLNALYNSWFWLGIWVLYYSRYGGYSAVGILELVMIVSTIIFEIPTGAIGDLLGKRKTLFLAYLFSGLSNIWMGVAPNLLHMVYCLILMNLAGALQSGTFEATIYDSLKDEKKESHYNRVISNMTAIRLITLAVSASIGGFMYKYSVGSPFIISGVIAIVGAAFSLLLTEPKVDSEKFTLQNYLRQNWRGFKQLFANTEITKQTLAILSVLFVTVIMYEGVNDILGINFGFTEIQLGILASVLCLAGAASSVLASKLRDKYKPKTLYLIGILLYCLSLLASPFVSLYVGAFTILVRNIMSPVIENEASTIINNVVESKYRATALSSFSMLQNLPYAVTVYFITAAADTIPMTSIAFVIGIFLVLAFGYNLAVFWKKKITIQG